MPRPEHPLLPLTSEGRPLLIEALAAWKDSGEAFEEFFPREYGLSPNSIYERARRFKIEIPTNRKHDREAVLEKQREDKTPAEVVAFRNGITVGTLRQWAFRYKTPMLGNKKWQKRRWWKAQLEAVDTHTLPAYIDDACLPRWLAIEYYQLLFEPSRPMVWDFSERPAIVSELDYDEVPDAIASMREVTPEKAEVFIAYSGKIFHGVWEEFVQEEMAERVGQALDEVALKHPDEPPIYPHDECLFIGSDNRRIPGVFYGFNSTGLAKFRSHQASHVRTVHRMRVRHVDTDLGED